MSHWPDRRILDLLRISRAAHGLTEVTDAELREVWDGMIAEHVESQPKQETP